ncbi:MAG: hypothetical protein J5I92_16870 [Thiogranum sp.]|nr:hypothetical protein [Thiogranum sp.]
MRQGYNNHMRLGDIVYCEKRDRYGICYLSERTRSEVYYEDGAFDEFSSNDRGLSVVDNYYEIDSTGLHSVLSKTQFNMITRERIAFLLAYAERMRIRASMKKSISRRRIYEENNDDATGL